MTLDALVLIVGTWVIALALVPLTDRWGLWTLPLLLTLGCSGSIIAICAT
jgi:predicted signal transduction protein with EAL and GGDEF domain